MDQLYLSFSGTLWLWVDFLTARISSSLLVMLGIALLFFDLYQLSLIPSSLYRTQLLIP